jgi:hypothetical protein
MNSHNRRTSGVLLLSALLLGALFVPGCKKESSPIPPAGTHVTSVAGKSDVFKQTSKGLQGECARIGCTCFIDGNQSTCALAFACLDAGFCELEKAKN